jgi:4-amino-4-deoxy-L-arabinose transferase-like glycosyltransferase
MLAPPPSEALGLWRASARRFQMRANRLAVFLAACAIAVLALGLVLTQQGRPGYLVQPDSAASEKFGTDPGLVLVGEIDEPQSATLAFDLLFFRRDVRYAPVIEPGKPDMIRYFAELPARGTVPQEASREIKVFDGEAPGPIRTLYRNLGYRVSSNAGLVDSSRATIQWPYFVSAAYLGISALVALAIALLQGRRIRRAEKLAESGEFKDDFETFPSS